MIGESRADAAPQAGRPLRADAERSMRAILEAAERVLSTNPAASMEQVAEAAGVARTTIHRRFASRQALIDALADAAVAHLRAAIDQGRPETAPPLVALHEITARVLRTKISWRFALDLPAKAGSAAAEGQQDIARRCLELFARARDLGLLAAGADLEWTRRVYYALIGEALHGDGEQTDPDILAGRVVETLLHGVSPRDR
ncbi:helix-turn-helix domain-containing protein [Phytohabitans sp. ZYX-F-186]|uniref:Helix-turn-helix domain-containing protein n=1 Tax=Phytohabitans maris TaxID=3071409 RepID=A0ABU0ZSH7_9ACTN|nr:helix-turn-helix domain-containing protein [Phytohabitans sp. ZYX-F-186]MDQ7909986.1 helix-turn-helix domain-containing protein [Phytohabitans sp. ZYX-F-186]